MTARNDRPGIAVRRLTEADADAFREIRLEALGAHPDAFGASFEEEGGQPLNWFEDRLKKGFVVGGADGAGRLAGMAGIYVPPDRKARHKAHLWGMYVRPEARGTGLAAALVQACLDRARTVAEEIVLGVGTHNGPALALYRSMGFVECGSERRAIKTGDRYYDEFLLAVRFEAGQT